MSTQKKQLSVDYVNYSKEKRELQGKIKEFRKNLENSLHGEEKWREMQESGWELVDA